MNKNEPLKQEAEESRDNSGDYLLRSNFATGIMLFCVIAACIALYFILQNASAILSVFFVCLKAVMPVIYGLVIAFILNPIMVFIENFLSTVIHGKKEPGKKVHGRIRLAAVMLSVVIAVWCVYVLIKMILPQTIDSIYMLVQDLPEQSAAFSNKMLDYIEAKRGHSDTVDAAITHATNYFNNWLKNDLLTSVTSVTKNLASGVFGFVNVVYKFVYNVLIGMIVAVYVLLSKEKFAGQGKKLMYGVFKTEHANTIIHYLRKSNDIFVGFITGKIVDSAIIGVLCFAITSIFSIPYAPLVSFIIGITNIIPVFGPFIGAVPSCILVLIVNPIQALYLAIIIVILQQIDGNLIGPKILGNSIGISAFWVLFSILLFGNLFGILGMIVGVPIFAIFYLIAKDITDCVLEKKHLSKDTETYVKLDYVELDEGSHTGVIYHDIPPKTYKHIAKPNFKKSGGSALHKKKHH